MKYITPRNSETGKKFAAIEQQLNDAHEACKKLAKELRIKEWRPCRWHVAGGMESIIFEKGVEVDMKTWKLFEGMEGEYTPRLSSKTGKTMAAKIGGLPKVERKDLNECIGFNGNIFRTIGFAMTNPEYYGFIVAEEWKVKIPADCEEVTTSRYNQMFDRTSKAERSVANVAK
jgi:hypothetical protein